MTNSFLQCQHPEECKNCKLGLQEDTNVVHSVLPAHAKAFFIGEAPGAEENQQGIPFVGQAGQLLNQSLEIVGINRNDIAISNVVSCRPPNNKAPSKKEMEACGEFLDKEIKLLNPSIIVALGSTPLKLLLPTAGGITNCRGKFFIHPEYNCYVYPTWHPAYILRNIFEKNTFIRDLQVVSDFLQGKPVAPEQRKKQYFHVRNRIQLDWLVEHLHKQPLWASDTETTSLDPLEAEVFMFIFSWRSDTAVTVDTRDFISKEDYDYLLSKMKEVYENNSKKIFQNGGFDIQCLFKYDIYVNNYFADTLLMHHLLDENTRTHGLEILAAEFTEMGGYDAPLQEYKEKHKIDNYKDFPRDMIEEYGAKDGEVTWRSFESMYPEIQAQKLDWLLHNVTIPAQKVLAVTEYKGVSIDLPYLKSTQKKYEEKMESVYNEVRNVKQVRDYELYKKDKLVNDLRSHWSNSKTLSKKFPEFIDYLKSRQEKRPDIIEFSLNINSPDHLKELLVERMGMPILRYTDKGGISVNDDVLTEYAKTNKFCEKIQKYRTLAHLKGTFLDGIEERISKIDGKIHTDFLLHGTATGRISSRNPNLNNIPRTGTAIDIKDIFCADKKDETPNNWGDWVMEADLGQAEFRFWIQYSQDPQALYDLRMGIDIHKLMAAAGKGRVIPHGSITWEQYQSLISDVTKAERQDAKLVVFGIMYGRGARSVAEQLGISVEQAQTIIDQFFKRYKQAKQWIINTQNFARQTGYVTNFFNRRRRLPDIGSSEDSYRAEAERQAINCLTKGTRILTTKGIIPIENIQSGDIVYNLTSTTSVINTAKSKPKQVVEVTFQNGYVFKCSEDHSFFILDNNGIHIKEVAVKDLLLTDYVVSTTHRKDYESYIYQPILFEYPYKTTENGARYWINDYPLPSVFSEQLAELCGILIGDGCMVNTQNSFDISIGHHVPEFVERCKYLLNSLFNYSAKEKLDKCFLPETGKFYTNYKIEVCSSKIKKYLEFIGIKGTYKTKRIPDIVFQSPLKVKWAFIKGLIDTDGGYSDEIVFGCYNEDLAQDFLQLLLGMGIKSKKGRHKTKKHIHSLVTIIDKKEFLEHITSSIHYKQESINRLKEKFLTQRHPGFSERAPYPILKVYQELINNIGPEIKVRNMREDIKNGEVSLRNLRKYVDKLNLKKYKTLNLDYLKIKSITYTSDVEEMYDIQVASKDQLFLGVGIAIHNSPIQGGASDLVLYTAGRIFKTIWKEGLKSRLILTVYDSLIFNIPDEELERVSKLVYYEMSHPPFSSINVPITAEVKIGTHWGSLKEVDLDKEEWPVIYNKLLSHEHNPDLQWKNYWKWDVFTHYESGCAMAYRANSKKYEDINDGCVEVVGQNLSLEDAKKKAKELEEKDLVFTWH
ncbi:MAG: DNA polymerase [Novosphingobium sp.]|nr:DNA polymerase [Novosphingobium sp.]